MKVKKKESLPYKRDGRIEAVMMQFKCVCQSSRNSLAELGLPNNS